MSDGQSVTSIVAARVPYGAHLSTLPRYFGRWALLVEGSVYNWMRSMCTSYNGGEWQFVALSNGGLFLVPRDGQYALSHDGNGYSGTVSAEAAGIIVTLFALSHLTFSGACDDLLICRFYQLRAFAIEHPEAVEIFRAID